MYKHVARNVLTYVNVSCIKIFSTYDRRRPEEQSCIISTQKFEGGFIIIWNCMYATELGEHILHQGSMNFSRYTANLEKVLDRSISKLCSKILMNNMLFQQDNIPCHKSLKP